jgi:hypothetical protein
MSFQRVPTTMSDTDKISKLQKIVKKTNLNVIYVQFILIIIGAVTITGFILSIVLPLTIKSSNSGSIPENIQEEIQALNENVVELNSSIVGLELEQSSLLGSVNTLNNTVIDLSIETEQIESDLITFNESLALKCSQSTCNLLAYEIMILNQTLNMLSQNGTITGDSNYTALALRVNALEQYNESPNLSKTGQISSTSLVVSGSLSAANGGFSGPLYANEMSVGTTLSVGEESTFNGPMTVNSNVIITGTTSLSSINGGYIRGSSLVSTGALNVTGTSYLGPVLSGSITSSGSINASTGLINGLLTTNSLSAASATISLSLSADTATIGPNAFIVNGESNLNGPVYVDGGFTVNGSIYGSSLSIINTGNTIDILSPTLSSSKVLILPAPPVTANLIADAPTYSQTLTGTFTFDKLLTASGLLSNGNLNVTGTSTLGSVTAQSLSVTGAITFSSIDAGYIRGSSLVSTGVLNITGTSYLGPVVSGSITSSGLLSTGNLNVTGTSYLGPVVATSLSVTGAITFSSIDAGYIRGSSLVSTGGLNVTGTSYLGPIVSGSIISSGSISASSATFTGAINALSATLTGALTVDSAFIGGGGLTVSVDAYFAGSLEIEGGIVAVSTIAGEGFIFKNIPSGYDITVVAPTLSASRILTLPQPPVNANLVADAAAYSQTLAGTYTFGNAITTPSVFVSNSGFTSRITAATLSSSNIYTIPATGSNANFVVDSATYTNTLSGTYNFNNAITTTSVFLSSSGFTSRIRVPTLASSNIYTIPATGVSANFVVDAASYTQTLSGTYTFSNSVTVGSSLFLTNSGFTSRITTPTLASTNIYTIPATGVNANFVVDAASYSQTLSGTYTFSNRITAPTLIASVFINTPQNFASGGATLIWDTSDFTSGTSMITVPSSTITVPVAGKYQIELILSMNNPSVQGACVISFARNGVPVISITHPVWNVTVGQFMISMNYIMNCAATNTITATTFFNIANVVLNTGAANRLQVSYIGT